METSTLEKYENQQTKIEKFIFLLFCKVYLTLKSSLLDTLCTTYLTFSDDYSMEVYNN